MKHIHRSILLKILLLILPIMFFLTSCVDSTALMKNVSDLYKFIGEHQVNTKKYDFTSNAYTTTEKNEQFINFLQPQAVLNGYIFNSIDWVYNNTFNFYTDDSSEYKLDSFVIKTRVNKNAMDYYLIINSRAKYNNQVPIEKCEIKLDIHFTNKEGKINLDYRFEKKWDNNAIANIIVEERKFYQYTSYEYSNSDDYLLYYNLKSLTNNNFPLYLLKADFQNIKFK